MFYATIKKYQNTNILKLFYLCNLSIFPLLFVIQSNSVGSGIFIWHKTYFLGLSFKKKKPMCNSYIEIKQSRKLDFAKKLEIERTYAK